MKKRRNFINDKIAQKQAIENMKLELEVLRQMIIINLKAYRKSQDIIYRNSARLLWENMHDKAITVFNLTNDYSIIQRYQAPLKF